MSAAVGERLDVAREVPAPRLLARVVASEWVRVRALPSTWTALGSFTGIMIGIGAAVASTRDPAALTAAEEAAFQPVATALSGVFMAQVALGLLGALLVTAERSSGAWLSSALAVPSARALLAGRGLLLLVLTTPVVAVATGTGAALGLTVLGRSGLDVAASDAVVVRAVLGCCGYLCLIGLLGLAVGSLLRSTAAAVVTLTGLLFLLPVLVGLLPAADDALPYLPSQAGQAVLQLGDAPGYLSPAVGLLTLTGYVTVVLAAAAVMAPRR